MDEALQRVSEWKAEPHNGGVRFTYSDDPLDFIWQTEDQAEQLVNVLSRALVKSRSLR